MITDEPKCLIEPKMEKVQNDPIVEHSATDTLDWTELACESFELDSFDDFVEDEYYQNLNRRIPMAPSKE